MVGMVVVWSHQGPLDDVQYHDFCAQLKQFFLLTHLTLGMITNQLKTERITDKIFSPKNHTYRIDATAVQGTLQSNPNILDFLYIHQHTSLETELHTELCTVC